MGSDLRSLVPAGVQPRHARGRPAGGRGRTMLPPGGVAGGGGGSVEESGSGRHGRLIPERGVTALFLRCRFSETGPNGRG